MVEVTLSFVLLIGSGLMVRSFIALQQVDAGYDASHVLTFVLQAPQRQEEERAAFIRQATARLRAIPGVIDVTAAAPHQRLTGKAPMAPPPFAISSGRMTLLQQAANEVSGTP